MLGSLSYFLGIKVKKDCEGMHLSQSKYILNLLKKTNMLECTDSLTPMSSTIKYRQELEEEEEEGGSLFEGITLYRSVNEAL